MARVFFVRNQGGLWGAAASPGSTADIPPTDLLVFTRAFPAWPAAHRLRLQPMAIFSASPFAGTKMLSWAANSILLEKARAEGYDDGLLLNEKGQIAECTSANFFLVRGGKVFTPPLSSGCLPGVTREVLLEIAPAAGVEVLEQEMSIEDLASADEVFISSSTREVSPVESIAPKWNYAAPGKITLALEAAFQDHIKSTLMEALAQPSSA
jgi:branched-chain amino acid aminotransferase